MENPMAALLDSDGKRHYMYHDNVVIGRGEALCAEDHNYYIVKILKDPTISRKHCIISRTGDNSYTICDLSSRGTFLNEKPLKKKIPTTLNHRDTITLLPAGIYSYKFWINKKWEPPENKEDNDMSLFLSEQMLPLEMSLEQIDQELALLKRKKTKKETNDGKEKELKEKRDSVNKLLSNLKEEKASLEERLRASEELRKQRERELLQERMLAEVDLETKISNLAKEKEELEKKLKERDMALIEKEKALQSQEEARVAKAAVEDDFMKDLEEKLQCSICVEIFIEPMILNCGHVFCKSCLDQWKKKNKICPMCRAKIVNCIRTYNLDAIIEKNVQMLSAEARQIREDAIEARTPSSKAKGKAKGGRKRKSTGEHATTHAAAPSITAPPAAPIAVPSTSTMIVPPANATPHPVPFVIHDVPIETVIVPEASTSVPLDPFAFTHHQQRRSQRNAARSATPVPVAAIDLTTSATPVVDLSYIDLTASPRH